MKTKSLFCWAGVVVSALPWMRITSSTAGEGGPPVPPPARSIPGITVEDVFPNGCIDCHIDYTEMKLDTRFSTLLSRWQQGAEPALLAKAQACSPQGVQLAGRHPEASDVLEDVPAGCIACHASEVESAPPFAEMIHAIHLAGGSSNHFVTVFQGECTHCHKLDVETGRWAMPSAREKP
jgi:hypothetical protein